MSTDRYPAETLDEDHDDGTMPANVADPVERVCVPDDLRTTDGYTRWHIYADGDAVLELVVSWSAGNPYVVEAAS